MTLQDFYLSNDAIEDFSEITVHTTAKDYVANTVNPLESSAFHYYRSYIVEHFRTDSTGHWHLLLQDKT